MAQGEFTKEEAAETKKAVDEARDFLTRKELKMDQCNPTVAESKVALAFSHLGQAVSGTEEGIKNLESRLSPILETDMPSEVGEPDKTQSTCKLIGDIDDLNDRMCKLDRSIKDILDRLQL